MQTCYLMHMIGVNINTVPVLDVRRKKSHNIIGNRSFNSIDKKIEKYAVNLSTLKNDTENIVEYVENNIDQNKKSFQFWELLKK